VKEVKRKEGEVVSRRKKRTCKGQPFVLGEGGKVPAPGGEEGLRGSPLVEENSIRKGLVARESRSNKRQCLNTQDRRAGKRICLTPSQAKDCYPLSRGIRVKGGWGSLSLENCLKGREGSFRAEKKGSWKVDEKKKASS